MQPDEENQAHSLLIEDRTGGYPRHHRINIDFVSTSEFRVLASSYQDVDGIKGPMTVKTVRGAGHDRRGSRCCGQRDRDRRRATRRSHQAGRRGEDAGHQLDAEGRARQGRRRHRRVARGLVEFFIAAGKKGFDVNRYKGLGEMNPDTLWETTMDPAKRTLLQVKAEDHTEADLMFTTLMGDQVEPRRKFIEDNALDVKNLDI